MNPKLLPVACAVVWCALISTRTSAAESIETSVLTMFKSLDAGDRAAALAYGPDPTTKFPVLTFDYDLDNKPVTYSGAEAVNRYMNSLFDTMAERKMKVASVVSKLVSGSSSPELGFASFEVTQTMTEAGRQETSTFRVTALASQDAQSGKWRIFLWQATIMPGNNTPPLAAATAPASAEPWLGTWVLNVAKTRINPGPKPRSETRTYTATADGERATYDTVDGDGRKISSSSTYKFDGKDAKLVDDPDADAMALTRTGPRSISAVVRKDGKVLRTATREVSEDGRTLTVQFKGANAKGHPIIEEVWVFDRQH